MMWLKGPSGVGESSLAQRCAKQLGTKLVATFLFSRSKTQDDPTRLFTSIAYQLATRYPLYCDKLDEKVFRDRSLLQKPINVQFEELIVTPFQELKKQGESIAEGAIFIDGLDECTGEDAQCTIIDVVSASVRDQTTPFIWAFFSRPELRIVSQISVPHIRPLCWQLNLPASVEVEGEIKLYLQCAFENIRAQYSVSSTAEWPSDDDIQELVDRSVGLFIYPTGVIRYVSEGGAPGPEERLRQVLHHPGKSEGNSRTHLDSLYSLVMEQVSKEILPDTLKLLLLLQIVKHKSPLILATILGFSMAKFFTALSKLHPVLKLTHSSDGQPCDISFYHKSFVDFLSDPERSKAFYPRTPERRGMLLGDMISLFDMGADRGMNLLFLLGRAVKQDVTSRRSLARSSPANRHGTAFGISCI